MKVLFFASVREALGTSDVEVSVNHEINDTQSLRAHLAETGGAQWRAVLEQPNLICAVNREVVHCNTALLDTDEVAFFPPVTGG